MLLLLVPTFMSLPVISGDDVARGRREEEEPRGEEGEGGSWGGDKDVAAARSAAQSSRSCRSRNRSRLRSVLGREEKLPSRVSQLSPASVSPATTSTPTTTPPSPPPLMPFSSAQPAASSQPALLPQ